MGSITQIKIKRRFELHGLHRSKFSLIYLTFLFICSFLILLNGCAQQKIKADDTLKGVSAQYKTPSAEELQSDGVRYYQKGDFGQAISKLEDAERMFTKEKNNRKRGDALILMAQAYQSIGQFEKSLSIAETAVALAKSSGDLYLAAKALNLSGTVYLGLGQTNKAQQYLDESLQMSRTHGSSKLTASILNNLGNLYTTQKEYDKAYTAYMECVSNLKDETDHELRGIALTNAATAAMRNEQFERSKSLLDGALNSTRSLANSRSKAYALINISLTYQALILNLPASKDLLLRQSSEIFNLAADVAEKIGDNLAISYASGYLGNLFEGEMRFKEALYLTRLAIFKAQEVNAHEALFRWQWQAGRIFKSLNNIDEALTLYRSSISTLESIRHEKAGCYGWSSPSISENLEKICFELADLLLNQAASIKEPAVYMSYLAEAREVIEVQRIYELRNYYKDDCVDAARSGLTKLDEVSKTSAIIYPIVFEDRIEILYISAS